MKLLNIEYDVVLPTLEAQMKARKAEKAAEKIENPDAALVKPVKPEKVTLLSGKPSMAPLVQGILDEREVRDKRNKDKFEKNGALKPKRDDKKKNNKLDKQP